MESIKEILMRRDEMSEETADEEIEGAREQLAEYLLEGDVESAENICQECFGLEPDYIMELM